MRDSLRSRLTFLATTTCERRALASIKLDGGLSEGLTLDKVAGAVERLVSVHEPIGLVYGAGFEHQPETIAAIARGIRVFGNDAETLKRAKDPLVLARVCEANGIRHPQVALAPPDEPGLWLMKKRGGAGGDHIAVAEAPRSRSARFLFSTARWRKQRLGFVPRDRQKGRNHRPQHAMDRASAGSPFRYGGAAGPIDIDPAQAAEIARCVAAIASELDLVGLNSVDFLAEDDAIWLLEINPRPGATLDVFELNETPLFARHIAACEGRIRRRRRRASYSRRPKSFTPLTTL